MKVTLIKPNIGRKDEKKFIDGGRMEPLQLGILGALTPPDIEVVLHDDRIESIPFDDPTDMVAITVEAFTARRAYEIADAYRDRGVPIVMGGMHPTLAPEEVSMHADAVCLGDAEPVWEEIVNDARHHRLRKTYKSASVTSLDGVIARRDLFKGKGYLPMSLTQFSRGCRHACEYCATSVYFKQQHFHRNPVEVVREVESLDRQLVFFVDDNIVSNRTAAKRLFKELIPLRIKWIGQATISMTHDRELMDLMARSGCIGNVLGFESIDRLNLKAMAKEANLEMSPGYREEIQILRDYGLQTWAAFTLGHDHDGSDTAERILEYCITNRFSFAAFNVLVPYPGTPLYRRLESEGRLLFNGRWWLHPKYRFNYASFIPRGMTPVELTESSYRARSGFNKYSSIIKRAQDLKTNARSPRRLALHLGYNLLVRREVFKKQGMYMGLTDRDFPVHDSSIDNGMITDSRDSRFLPEKIAQ